MSVLTRAMISSAVVRRARHLASGSVVCAVVAAAARWPNVTQWLRQTRQRIVVGAGGEWSAEQESRTVEQLDMLMSSSLIAAALSSLVMAPIVASREAGLRHVCDRMLSLDVPARVRAGSCAIIVAALCQTALLALFGVPVYALGWSIRAALIAAGTIAFRRPEAVAAAWRDQLTP